MTRLIRSFGFLVFMNVQNSNRPPFRVVLIASLSFWSLFLLIDVLKKDFISGFDPVYFYGFYLFGFLLWVLLTFPLITVFHWSRQLNIWFRVFFLLLLGPVVGFLKVVLSWTSFYFAISYFRSITIGLVQFIGKQTTFHYVEASIIVWVVMILFFLAEVYLKYQQKSLEAAELQAQLYQSQLESLKMQLQPHFLFNAHNTISMLIRTEKYDQAIDVTSRLSELLRMTLSKKEDTYITLKEEMAMLRKYLEIEMIRFEDVLTIQWEIDPKTLFANLPNMILQPIVENAFKHGISKHLGEARLLISSEKTLNSLKITVENSGPHLPKGFVLENGIGYGLKNVHQRLEKGYHDDFKLELCDVEHGVRCTIALPFKS